MLYPSVENLFDEMFNGFGDDFFDNRRPLLGNGKHEKSLMRTDVNETKDAYELKVDVPGYKKDEIKVKLDDGFLTISANKVTESTEREDEHGKTRKNGRVIRQERYVGAMSRSWYVGDDVDQNKVKAKYENGVLELTIPKTEPKKELPENQKYIAIEG